MVEDAVVVSKDQQIEELPEKKRGRPKGSKNRPKISTKQEGKENEPNSNG